MSLETKQKNRDTRKISNEGNVMPRLRQIPRTEADASVLPFYDALFGKDCEPTTHPGTATGTPGNWWTVFAHVPDALHHMVSGLLLEAPPEYMLRLASGLSSLLSSNADRKSVV